MTTIEALVAKTEDAIELAENERRRRLRYDAVREAVRIHEQMTGLSADAVLETAERIAAFIDQKPEASITAEDMKPDRPQPAEAIFIGTVGFEDGVQVHRDPHGRVIRRAVECLPSKPLTGVWLEASRLPRLWRQQAGIWAYLTDAGWIGYDRQVRTGGPFIQLRDWVDPE